VCVYIRDKKLNVTDDSTNTVRASYSAQRNFWAITIVDAVVTTLDDCGVSSLQGTGRAITQTLLRSLSYPLIELASRGCHLSLVCGRG
jgi:hypothetical protein